MQQKQIYLTHSPILVFAVYFLFSGIVQEQPFQILMQLITKTIVWIFNMVYFLSPEDSDDDQEDETKVEVKAV
jgi:hypothetical protein